jgi:hypothetical protein
MTDPIDLAHLDQLPAEQLPDAFKRLLTAAASIWIRLMQKPQVEPDRLVDAPQAAAMLSVSKDHLYRSRTLRTLRVTVDGRVKYSTKAIQRYIARQTGR